MWQLGEIVASCTIISWCRPSELRNNQRVWFLVGKCLGVSYYKW